MAIRRVFGLVEGNDIVAVGDDLNAVIAKASGPVQVMDGAESNDGDPARGRITPALAMRFAGLPPVTRAEVEGMDLKTAFERLRALGLRDANAAVMARNFLKSNAKMAKNLDAAMAAKLAKAAPSVRESRDSHLARLQAMGLDDGICRGVVLLPYDFAASGMGRKLPMTKTVGLCAGSTQACRDSCLAFAGKNTATNEATGDSNLEPKARYVEALYKQPAAFLRMLLESVRKHAAACAKKRAKPFVRLNVLSDIPWEAWAPWFFDLAPKIVQFYDYTKVPGRKPPRNYDLTLSFSGNNDEECKAYLRKGGRVAVVFVHAFKGGKEDKTPADRPLARAIPKTWWGARVVDGDGSDIRPLDPGGVVVALRWKVFQGRNLAFADGVAKTNKTVLQRSIGSRFVYPWYLDEESGFIFAAETPGNLEGSYVNNAPIPE